MLNLLEFLKENKVVWILKFWTQKLSLKLKQEASLNLYVDLSKISPYWSVNYKQFTE